MGFDRERDVHNRRSHGKIFMNIKDHWRRRKNLKDAFKKSGAGVSDVPGITWRYFGIMESLMVKECLGMVESNLVLPELHCNDTEE
ncbi:uncharacterized protein LOC144104100 isoform X2 [Amblyomma americanum]